MILLDGKKLKKRILNNLKKEIKEKQLKLSLAVVLVGEDLLFKTFVEEKEKACKEIGIGFNLFKFPEIISEEDFKEEVKKIERDYSGVVVQLPLPEKLHNVFNVIPFKKDPDVLSKEAKEKFREKKLSVLPPVVCAVFHLIKEYDISLKDKEIVLVGKGKLVGEPLSVWLSQKGIDFSVVKEDTEKSEKIIKKADVLITGVGKAGLIKGDMVKEGAVVMDAGTSFKEGKISGDVDFETVSKKASYITPVPGGIGPLTVACLLENLVELNK